MKMAFDPKSPVQTRDGHKARIICTDAADRYPIVALIWQKSGEYTENFDTNGRWSSDKVSDMDLINVPAVPTFRPWTIDEFPVGAVFRDKETKRRKFIVRDIAPEPGAEVLMQHSLDVYEWLWPHEQFHHLWRICGVEIKP